MLCDKNEKGTLLGYGLYEVIFGILIGVLIIIFVIFLWAEVWGSGMPEAAMG